MPQRRTRAHSCCPSPWLPGQTMSRDLSLSHCLSLMPSNPACLLESSTESWNTSAEGMRATAHELVPGVLPSLPHFSSGAAMPADVPLLHRASHIYCLSPHTLERGRLQFLHQGFDPGCPVDQFCSGNDVLCASVLHLGQESQRRDFCIRDPAQEEHQGHSILTMLTWGFTKKVQVGLVWFLQLPCINYQSNSNDLN